MPCSTSAKVVAFALRSAASLTKRLGVSISGMMNKPAELAQVPPNWGLYFRVPALEAAVERVKAGGGKILNGPMEVPGGDWIVNAMDPQGASFALHARKTA